LETILLEDELIRLEPLNQHHVNDMIEFALQEPDTWQFSLVSPGGSAEGMQQYVDYAIQQQKEKKSIPLAVILKSTNRVIGSSRFYDVDFSNKIATIGYTWYGKQYRRTSVNRRCKLLMLTQAFEKWEVERVEFRADIHNTISIAAMKAIGCKEEGVLRNHATTDTGRRTSMVLSILKEEWYSEVKSLLMSKII
jgi:N-acetyltransferase